jgi:UDP-glucuronate 4-epimerase
MMSDGLLDVNAVNTKRALVSGCAGFIGSRLTQRLLGCGFQVVGVDSLSTYYDVRRKRGNLEALAPYPEFRLHELDIASDGLTDLLEGVDVVFHLAGQPGVRASWSKFDVYLRDNVLATQRLLAASEAASVAQFVYASSSSVYGDAPSFPTSEHVLPHPVSPYGVTKLAGEHLVSLYGRGDQLHTTSLRYFTVYGPGQRPDMAIQRILESCRSGITFDLFGSGQQMRDFTFVEDVVDANLAALGQSHQSGLVFNVCGGSAQSMNDVIAIVQDVTGVPPPIRRISPQRGDVARTGGSNELAGSLLAWQASTPFRSGVLAQWQHILATPIDDSTNSQ